MGTAPANGTGPVIGPARGPRLFSALLPSAETVAALRRELARHRGPATPSSMRWSTVEQWHVTLGFYGPGDPDARAAWLGSRLAGLRAPVLRLAGVGTFPGVLWLGVEASGLSAVATAARPEGERRPFVAHLTLARATSHRADRSAVAELRCWHRLLAGFTSPAWTASDVVLMRSDSHADGTRYGVVERFPLDAPEEPRAPAGPPRG